MLQDIDDDEGNGEQVLDENGEPLEKDDDEFSEDEYEKEDE